MLVICPYPEGVAAGQRLKYEQYLDEWRANGWQIDTSCYMDMPMWEIVFKPGNYAAKFLGVVRGHARRLCDLLRIGSYDLVYIHMWVTPVGTSIMERLTRLLAKRMIIDIEDNVLERQKVEKGEDPNRLVRWLKGPNKARYLVANADHVITASPFVNDACMELNKAKACTLIPPSVDTDRFVPANLYKNDHRIVVGWTGTFSSKVYLEGLEETLRELATRAPFTLKVIGNFDYELEGVEVESIRWTAEHEVRDLQTFDIGIYPLPMDDWVLGKAGLKTIQYMAFGLPSVSTNVGATPFVIKDRETGILVETPEQWRDALEDLILNAALRKKLGEAGRRSAVERFSLHAVGLAYGHVLKTVMGEPSA